MGTRRRWLTIGLTVLIGLVGLIIAGYWFNWDWTGFNQHIGPRVQQYQPTKTLWDWLQLLVIPVVLAVAALLFNRATTRTEQQIAATRYEQDQKIALDKQREDLLQAYLDRMSELLLEKNLRTSKPNSEVRNVARVRTITILFQLDARRIGYVFAFLRESGLMSIISDDTIVSLSDAALNNVNWSQANLSRTNLSGADLNGANLSEAYLSEANLSRARLDEANLSEARLYKANLSGARLYRASLSGALPYEANLYEAILYEADLSEAYHRKANLRKADLSKTNLSGADLSEADLSGADLSKANLSRADLSGAVITEEQLKKAKLLAGATMPDGSKHP